MRCFNCGAEIEPNSVACPRCGAGVRRPNADMTAEQPLLRQSGYNMRPNQPPRGMTPLYSEPIGQPVSVLRWVGRMFLPWIPIVGGLVYFIMIIVWACGDKFDETSKNWAIASIIMIAFNLLVTIVIFCIFYAVFMALFNDASVQRQLQMFFDSVPYNI